MTQPASDPLPESEPLPRTAERTSVELAEHGFAIQSAAQLWSVAAFIAKSALKPHGINSQADVFLVMAYGQMYGFHEMEALQRLHVVKGKVCLGAADMAAKIQAHPLCRSYRIWTEGEGDALAGCVQSERAGRGGPNAVVRFTLAQARRAGLYDEKWRDRNGEPSVWVKYPEDQLIWKAVARDYRRNWPDAVRGASVYEDLREVEREREEAPTAVRTAPPPPASPQLMALAQGARPAELTLPTREREPLHVNRSPVAPAAAEPRRTAEDPGGGASAIRPGAAPGVDAAPLVLEVVRGEPGESGAAPDAATPPKPLSAGLLAAIEKRVRSLLPEHQPRGREDLVFLAELRTGQGWSAADVIGAIRDWRPQWGK